MRRKQSQNYGKLLASQSYCNSLIVKFDLTAVSKEAFTNQTHKVSFISANTSHLLRTR